MHLVTYIVTVREDYSSDEGYKDEGIRELTPWTKASFDVDRVQEGYASIANLLYDVVKVELHSVEEESPYA